ncbi:MAG: rod shape-determining protein MreC [Methylococcaceae bacterium]
MVIKLLFATGPAITTRLLGAVLLSILLLVLDKNSTRLANVRAALSIVVYPVLVAVNWPTEFVQEIKDSAFSFAELRAEISKLKEQQFVSDIKLLKIAALEKENIRLRSLLESSYNIGEQVLVAEILSVNLMPFDHVVSVNKGSRFGVHIKQPVLDTQGLIGQVVRTLPLSSEIMLITDPNHAIPVQINRNGLRTIAVGSGQLNRLVLPYLPNNADIKKGDLLITSGMGGTFPQGYPVAIVDDFEVQPHKPFAYISATPKAALDKIREVLIVWSDAKSVPLTLPTVAPLTPDELATETAKSANAPALKPVEPKIPVQNQSLPPTAGQSVEQPIKSVVTPSAQSIEPTEVDGE